MTKFKTHIYKPNGGHLKITIETAKPLFKDGHRIGEERGKYAEFIGGVFETDDQKVIDFLKGLSTFGVDFFEVPEAEKEPQSQAPSEPKIETLTKPQLLELAKERNIEVEEGLNRAELIERLKAK